MRIRNPNAAAPSPVTAADKTDLQAALTALAAVAAPTFAEIRAALPVGKRARFTDGMIHQAALDLGLKVEE
jgi:hypothetical protein